MIYDNFSNLSAYKGFSKGLDKVIEWAKTHKVEELPLGRTEIDWGKGTVCRGGTETALTAKEFALLKKLWEARGNIVTMDALCGALWDGPLVGYENTLMVHIRRLREKIEVDPSHPQFLLTARGLGYRLNREAKP